ncbi:MAG: hypothetical protein VCC00_09455 [Deltaproteobacteria bacterium]
MTNALQKLPLQDKSRARTGIVPLCSAEKTKRTGLIAKLINRRREPLRRTRLEQAHDAEPTADSPTDKLVLASRIFDAWTSTENAAT